MAGESMHDGVMIPNFILYERHMNASRKRIMFTHWLGEAYIKFKSSKYRRVRVASWQQGACLAGTKDFDASKVEVLGLCKPFKLCHASLLTDEYRNEHFSGFPNFNFRS